MGTRGAIGFWKDGEHKVTYNHFDSYPDALGNDVLNFIHKWGIAGTNVEGTFNTAFEKIQLIKEDSVPTEEQIEQCKKYTDLEVGDQSTTSWYYLLREAQGDLEAYADVGFMPDDQEFLNDSLFCEYAYILNLTDNILEVYKGFQKEVPKGRYSEALADEQGYYGVGLVATYPLDDCPTEFSAEQTPELFNDED